MGSRSQGVFVQAVGGGTQGSLVSPGVRIHRCSGELCCFAALFSNVSLAPGVFLPGIYRNRLLSARLCARPWAGRADEAWGLSLCPHLVGRAAQQAQRCQWAPSGRMVAPRGAGLVQLCLGAIGSVITPGGWEHPGYGQSSCT